jgi:putative spermidine/putrescine transport system permease protein
MKTIELLKNKYRIQKMQWLLLLLPTIIYLCFVYLLPLLKMLTLCLFNPTFTTENFSAIFESASYLKVLWLTFKISFIVTLICLLLGYAVAYIFIHTPVKILNILMICVIIPFWTSMLVRTYAWMVILGRQGILNQVFLGSGIIDQPLRMIHNSFAVYVGMVHILLPYMILPIYSVMKGIDKNLNAAAQSLGANRLMTFLKVFLPLSLPGVVSGSILVFILALGFFITPALLGGISNVMISMQIERQVNELLQWGMASALAVTLLILTVIVFIVFRQVAKWLNVDIGEASPF